MPDRYCRALLVAGVTTGPLIAMACGSSASDSDGPAVMRGGSSSSGSGGTSSSKGGASSAGSSGTSAIGGAAGDAPDGNAAGSGASAGDGASGEGGAAGAAPSSCNNGSGTCDPYLLVPGGDFLRSDTDAATVSSFRLGRYEVTVSEFRAFVAAVVGGYRPDAGSGKHSHLSGGMGLERGASGEYEPGWDSSWDTELPDSAEVWNDALTCNSPSNWTAEAGENESLPISCASWHQAYAYCIWAGGFLPSEAEWNYAAAGGDEQRTFPWGSQDPDSTRVVSGVYQAANVGSKPDGDGRWGHSDLAGNLSEWTLDSFSAYVAPCVDCAYLADDEDRVVRGGNYLNTSPGSFGTAARGYANPSGFLSFGFRCARAPD